MKSAKEVLDELLTRAPSFGPDGISARWVEVYLTEELVQWIQNDARAGCISELQASADLDQAVHRAEQSLVELLDGSGDMYLENAARWLQERLS